MRSLLGLFLVVALGCGDDSTHDNSKDAGDTTPTAGRGSSGTGGSKAQAGVGAGGVTGTTAGKGGTGGKDNGEIKHRVLPLVYPLVRASTPSALIANPEFKPEAIILPPPRHGGVGVLPQALGGEINLAQAIQERFYTMGPTELLRIVSNLDGRVSGVDTDPAKHPCLNDPPTERVYNLPGNRTFAVQLQCLQNFGAPGSAGAGWMAFGFGSGATSSDNDAGADAADAGQDPSDESFYLVEGQEGGMGGAYRITGDDVEAWVAVADSNAPNNSQVLMHLVTHKAPATSELALAGSGVGFCAAHLKTSLDYIYVEGKTNAPPPPGTPMMAGTQYCDAQRSACYAVGALNTALDAQAEECRPIAGNSFDIHGVLDASSDPEANVVPDQIYMFFRQRVTGVQAY